MVYVFELFRNFFLLFVVVYGLYGEENDFDY